MLGLRIQLYAGPEERDNSNTEVERHASGGRGVIRHIVSAESTEEGCDLAVLHAQRMEVSLVRRGLHPERRVTLGIVSEGHPEIQLFVTQ